MRLRVTDIFYGLFSITVLFIEIVDDPKILLHNNPHEYTKRCLNETQRKRSKTNGTEERKKMI